MILFQALFTALTGYGLGIGLASLLINVRKTQAAELCGNDNVLNLGLAFVMVLIIAGISSYIGVRKVLKIEPFDIFRGSMAEIWRCGQRSWSSGLARVRPERSPCKMSALMPASGKCSISKARREAGKRHC